MLDRSSSGGDQGNYSTAVRINCQPALDIHRISGGFTGEAGKSAIVSQYTAKLNTHLLLGKSPE
jgi:hypothetical protein